MTGQKAATAPGLDPDSLELAPGTKHENLEGWAPVLGSDAEVLDALEKAFDYRGDVTITLQGWLGDRRIYLRSPDGSFAGPVLGPAVS